MVGSRWGGVLPAGSPVSVREPVAARERVDPLCDGPGGAFAEHPATRQRTALRALRLRLTGEG